jgi:nucleotide-binding universal stress UspA family protein
VPGIDCVALLVQGPTVDKILDEAAALEVDLVVVGSQGKGPVRRLFVGSTSPRVLRESITPVLLAPSRGG